jgi:hypothetical protein
VPSSVERRFTLAEDFYVTWNERRLGGEGGRRDQWKPVYEAETSDIVVMLYSQLIPIHYDSTPPPGRVFSGE